MLQYFTTKQTCALHHLRYKTGKQLSRPKFENVEKTGAAKMNEAGFEKNAKAKNCEISIGEKLVKL